MQRIQRRPSGRAAGAGAATKPASKNSSKAAAKGARAYKTRWRDRWQGYLAHHRSSASDSLQRLLATPVQSIMTWLVIAVALALPATLFTSLGNVQSLGQRWEGAPQLTVFLNPRAKDSAISSFQRQVEAMPGIEQVIYVSAEAALEEFETESGMGNALRTLDSNPLPATLLVAPGLNVTATELVKLGETLEQQALVDEVVFDRAWIERLHQMLALGEKVALALGGLLALGVLLVIGNTIRLAIESRRDEIVIIKLVGGTDAFVRRPFLYTGLWYGLVGGVLALLLLSLLLLLLSGPVATLSASYQSTFELQGLGFGGSLVLVGLGALIGWLGAWLAVGRHLGEIEPQ
ncbi:cell division protein FtsX [Aestuariicella hydrocarbonica]|uniref:Cell division protein FtsX n=1 Tax=Pseudomaricurvus hydrocarbonicus TaxID=1470433 RepID=A0A9E5MPE1_9GAMM|nr:permease-like cell division protein FtsX [Aestuariicella hydrocarbonica]NHO67985.1 cell division protein FtsX [Aestuariicella hydrocarbonica]